MQPLEKHARKSGNRRQAHLRQKTRAALTASVFSRQPMLAVSATSLICRATDRPSGLLRRIKKLRKMDREYDIFEVLQSGPVWRCCVKGLVEARAKVEELTRSSSNEFYAMHLPSQAIVARAKKAGGNG